jgi:hypothetical protein
MTRHIHGRRAKVTKNLIVDIEYDENIYQDERGITVFLTWTNDDGTTRTYKEIYGLVRKNNNMNK